MDILNKSEKFCDLVKLKEKGTVVYQEFFTNMFETLAFGFKESSDIMTDKILKELITVKNFTYFYLDNIKITLLFILVQYKHCYLISNSYFKNYMKNNQYLGKQ